MRNPFDLHGKVAIVTGGSRGIGRAIAEQFAAQGASVTIGSRKEAACLEVAQAINQRGVGRAIGVAVDIAVKGQLQELVNQTRAAHGPVDILVCNAASNSYFGPMARISDDQFRKIIDNNLLANHALIQMVVGEMIERRAGCILIITSIGALRGSALIGAYNVSKAANMQLARNLAVELGSHGIRVNCIAPGVIKTDFSKALWSNSALSEASLRGIPLGRYGEPEDVAGAAVFLASDAGRYVTGQYLIVDGGATVTVGGI